MKKPIPLKSGDQCPTCLLLPFQEPVGNLVAPANQFGLICDVFNTHVFPGMEFMA